VFSVGLRDARRIRRTGCTRRETPPGGGRPLPADIRRPEEAHGELGAPTGGGKGEIYTRAQRLVR